MGSLRIPCNSRRRRTAPFLAAAMLLGVFHSVGRAQDVPAGLEPAKGRFLVATEDMADPEFYRSVVLLLSYDLSGAMGVVVNQSSTHLLHDAFPDVEELRKRNDKLFIGGPVGRGSALMLVQAHKQPAESVEILPGVYLSGSIEVLKKIIVRGRKDERFRIYAGHAGWSPGQLEAEIRDGGWLVVRGDAGSLFEKTPEQLWEHLLSHAQGEWAQRAVKPKRASALRVPPELEVISWRPGSTVR
jgi:putative transcriptional regulator